MFNREHTLFSNIHGESQNLKKIQEFHKVEIIPKNFDHTAITKQLKNF